MSDLEAAWDEIHDAKPDGWFVGPPTHEEHRHEWTMYAFDTRERPNAGHRSREWRPSGSPTSGSWSRWRGACD